MILDKERPEGLRGEKLKTSSRGSSRLSQWNKSSVLKGEGTTNVAEVLKTDLAMAILMVFAEAMTYGSGGAF